MKTHFLFKDVTDTDTLNKGIAMVTEKLASIGIEFTFEVSSTSKQFTGLVNNYTDTTGNTIKSVIVNPQEIISESVNFKADTYCLIYDWTKVTPQPTNPADGGKYMQIPVQWYVTYPEVFAQFFLHELCHQITPDLTHNQYQNPDYSQKPPTDYYLYLLKTYYKSPITDTQVVIGKTLKRGSIGQDVVKLQKDLNILGFYSGVYLPIFGPATEKAVMNFQVRNKLLADGIVGTKTLALIELLKKNSTKWGLKPLVDRKAMEFLQACKEQGELIKITEGYRSFERQNELYAQGRTKPGVIITKAKGGQSYHQFGVAFDVCFVKTGYKGNWDKIGKIGKSLGFEWGKSFGDQPHFQLTLGYKLKSFQQNTIDWSKFA